MDTHCRGPHGQAGHGRGERRWYFCTRGASGGGRQAAAHSPQPRCSTRFITGARALAKQRILARSVEEPLEPGSCSLAGAGRCVARSTWPRAVP